MGFSDMIPLFVINAWCWWTYNRKTIFKTFILTIFGSHKVLIYVRFFILIKLFIYSGCQMATSLIDITSIIAGTNKFIENLGKMFTFIWILCWKSTSQLLTLTFQTFRLLQNLLQSWSVFFCVCLECSPTNGSLKYLILVSNILF